MSALLLALALLVPPAWGSFDASDAPAGKKKKPVYCPEPEQFVEKIYNCGRNAYALQLAKACELALKKQGDAAGGALDSELRKLAGDEAAAQDSALSDARERLERGIEDLTKQIENLQANTARVASYTRAMIDAPDGVDDDTSLDCFSDNFHPLQEIVTRLDKKIVEAKAAREKAIDLADSLAARAGSLGGAPEAVAAVKGGGAEPAKPAPAGGGGGAQGASDITGLPAEKPANP